jgi:predicted Zn-dependent peptidase
VAELFGGYLARGDLTPLKNYENAINTLTTKELQEVARLYFTPDKSTTVILRKGKK